MSEPDLPDELRGPLIKLWGMEQRLRVAILPRDCFTAVAVLQFALRNPQLSAVQKEQGIAVARALQAAVAALDPIVGKYLEMGWDSQYDTPADDPPF